MTLKDYQQRALTALTDYFRETSQIGRADFAFMALTERTMGQGLPYVDVGQREKLDELRGLPYVCVRIPTGGGKTIVAAHTPARMFDALLGVENGVVLWLVPSNAILEQTLSALKDREHPYHQALTATLGAVTVMDVTEALYLNRSDVDGSTVVIVATIQSFRREDTTGTRVYRDNGALMDHFSGLGVGVVDGLDPFGEGDGAGRPAYSLANVLRLHRPVVIVDEAHNARTELSFGTLARLRPACIVEFTATPDHEKTPSNVLVSVSAAELKAEQMIKLPLELTVQTAWREALDEAVRQRLALERVARDEEAATGEYIRPILLVQCQSRSKTSDTVDIDTVEGYLTESLNLPRETIARATGSDWELDGVDLSSPDCRITTLLTVQALKEGWDCPFAYVLCSVSNVSTSTSVEQIIGRVLRMPKARRKGHDALNRSYAVVASTSFADTLRGLRDALVGNGFERAEVGELIRAATPPSRQGELGDLPLFGQPPEDAPDPAGQRLSVVLPEPPEDVSAFPPGVEYVADSKTLTIPAGADAATLEVVRDALPGSAHPGLAVALAEAGRSPAERGERLRVPVLSVKQGDLFEVFEKTHLLEVPWKLSNREATLGDYTPRPSQARRGRLDVDDASETITTSGESFVPALQSQMAMFAKDVGWDEVQLVRWLDRALEAPDVTPDDRERFLTKLVMHLTRDRGFSLSDLLRDRFALRRAVNVRVAELRREAMGEAHQLFLDGTGPAELVVSPEQAFEYPLEPVYSKLYEGSYRFKNHHYGPDLIGDMNGEEEECAMLLDGLDEVDVWVRNPERQARYAFWLQTSSDRFYPDFVARLEDGRILVVEVKGGHLATADDARKKDVLGRVWAEKSGGRCLFVMPPPGKIETAVRGTIGSARA